MTRSRLAARTALVAVALGCAVAPRATAPAVAAQNIYCVTLAPVSAGTTQATPPVTRCVPTP